MSAESQLYWHLAIKLCIVCSGDATLFWWLQNLLPLSSLFSSSGQAQGQRHGHDPSEVMITWFACVRNTLVTRSLEAVFLASWSNTMLMVMVFAIFACLLGAARGEGCCTPDQWQGLQASTSGYVYHHRPGSTQVGFDSRYSSLDPAFWE